mmetsp:Transcript_51623/g.122858  ORF Transcript_51623/g.122858 Transcript_51623/m.122858 type:complete len:695 (+) Transcript_51623:69-2153(+)
MGNRPTCGKACSNCTADCARPNQGNGDDLDDEHPVGDPAGATFEETLDDLNGLDRQLMLFCATTNLSAVRWLLHLGAHWEACDANGTTCLHVACRSGGIAVVKELMRYKQLLEATDIAGWSPLHVAVLLGRTEVVVRLLQAGAPPHAKNSKSQKAVELCADNSTFEALHAFERHSERYPGRPWEYDKEFAENEDLAGNRLQYEPFFVPRQPVLRSTQFRKEFQKIGVAMFNQQPGYGLGFLVLSGITRDYPVDMSAFLRRSKVSPTQVGNFLGEAFSLSHTIRLEFINSVLMQRTGIVSGMARAFRAMRLPDDLQKINRLVHGVARIWWRQNEKMAKEQNHQASKASDAPVDPDTEMTQELSGLELKQYLTSSEVVQQLMFSTVMLHWFVHRDGKVPRKVMDFSTWKKLNEGIEAGGTDVPDHIQVRIHHTVCQNFIPELAVASVETAAADAGGTEDGDLSEKTSGKPEVLPGCSLEGWVQMVGSGLPQPGLNGVRTSPTSYKTMSSMFSESTNGSALKGGFGGSLEGNGMRAVGATAKSQSGIGGMRKDGQPYAMPIARRDDFAWMSLCHTLLFFATSQGLAPYAFIDLKGLRVSEVQVDNRSLILVGATPEEARSDLALTSGANQPGGDTPAAQAPTPAPLTMVYLLPDGRWQDICLTSLELRVTKAAELEMWSKHLSAGLQPTEDPHVDVI